MRLARGDQGPRVAALQRQLNAAGAALAVDGIFGVQTERVLRRYQARHNLATDGIYGAKTRRALAGDPSPRALAPADLRAAAQTLGVELAAVQAVNQVESCGAGFIDDSPHPVVLYERHVMRRRLAAHGYDVAAAERAHPDLVSRRAGGYAGGAAEWPRFERAATIDRASAIEATSWGLFQILGWHWPRLGYASAAAYAAAMATDEAAQLAAFVAFIRAEPRLHAALAARDWSAFAAGYNGPGYDHNNYDGRLAAAWRRQRRARAA